MQVMLHQLHIKDGMKSLPCGEKLNKTGNSLPFGSRVLGSRNSSKKAWAHASRGEILADGMYSSSLLTTCIASGGVRGRNTLKYNHHVKNWLLNSPLKLPAYYENIRRKFRFLTIFWGDNLISTYIKLKIWRTELFVKIWAIFLLNMEILKMLDITTTANMIHVAYIKCILKSYTQTFQFTHILNAIFRQYSHKCLSS